MVNGHDLDQSIVWAPASWVLQYQSGTHDGEAGVKV
jgi:hypothetical protein